MQVGASQIIYGVPMWRTNFILSSKVLMTVLLDWTFIQAQPLSKFTELFSKDTTLPVTTIFYPCSLR